MKMPVLHRLGARHWASIAIAGGLAAVAAVAVNGAPVRTRVTPYLEFQQVLSADFNGGDVLTYSGVGGGVNAEIATQRVQATIAYNYQRRIAWNDGISDDDSHNGLAAVHVEAVPGLLGFDAGAMATQTHSDPRIPVAGVRTIDSDNTAEVYSAYAGPTLNTRVGPVTVGAAYRLGYVHVDDHSLAGGDLPPGAPRVNRYSSSTVHNLTASAGMAPGDAPVGWTVGGGYVREDMNRFDSKFEAAYIRGDVVYPVSPHIAVTAGVGYETGEGSQQDIQRTAGGVPVVGPNGTVLPDPSKPRLLTYDESGLIWDAGVIWRPSPRTELQARVGRRYGGTTFTGSLEHRINQSYALSASIYDNVSSFGRLLVADLSGVPQAFDIRRSGFGGGSQGAPGCVYGNDPSTGVCFDDALQSINNFNFRNRGASVQLSGGRGPWGFGVGASYNNRRYYAPPGDDFVLHGVTDQSVNLSAHALRKLSRTAGFDLSTYASWFDSGLASENAFSTGVTGTYYQSILGDRIQANASAGVYSTQSGPYDSTIGAILFGLRYSF
ncbi:MAG TPA: hypothetical protein VGB48_06965 [Allosphingosinicella sp.]|jgi:uncharacterized protein (PEP-CTERM system associated)